VALLTLLASAQQSQITRTWDGGGADGNWSTPGNWSGDDAPDGTSEAALFTNDPVGQTRVTANLSADITIGQLQFSAAAPSYTITGTGPATLFLSPSASFGGLGVTVASGAANQSITAAEVEFLSSQTWDVGGTTTLTVSGTIEDDSVLDYGLTKNGSGTLVFPGDVRYDGATILNAGSLVVSFSNTSMLSAITVNGGLLRATTSANALGNSSTRNTITLAGGTLELANNTALTFGSTSRATTVSGNATIRSDRLSAGAGVTHALGTLGIGAQTLSVASGGFVNSGSAGITFGATTLSGNATFDVVNGSSATAQLTVGAVGQSGGTRSLRKTGSGTLLLNGAGSYTGGTTLSQGTLTLGVANALGSGGFTFAGGTLNGNNTTDSSIGALALTANSTLRLSPGGAAATLTFGGVSGAATGVLTIIGWSGSPGGLGTNDKIIFSGGTTPSADFLQRIRFDLGDGNTYVGALGAGGELIPASASTGTVSFTAVEHLGNPTDTSIAINVVPDANATIYYEYGTASGAYTQQTPPVAALASQPAEVILSGLQPNTRYFYRMRYEAAANPGTWTARNEYQFRTQRAAGSTYSFVLTSDSHVNLQLGTLSQWQTTLDMIAADRPDFMIDLGDTFAMDNGTTSVTSAAAADQVYLFQRSAGILGRASHSVPMFFAMGNHENEEGWNFNDANPQPIWGMRARKKYFPQPSPLTAPGFYSANTDPVEANDVTAPNSHVIGSDQYREDYYAWTWGDALFVVFDPFHYTMQNPYGASAGEGNDDPAAGDRWNWTMGIQQHQWLNNVLSTSTAKYKFLFAHHMLGGTQNYVRGGAEPAHQFEWGGYNADGTTWGWDTRRPAAAGWIKPVRQMMIDYDVTAFFHGHDHQFAYEQRDGMVYQEVPAASQGTTSGFGSYNSSPYLVSQSSNSGYLRVTISPSQALVEYVKTTGTNVGQVQYSYTMAPSAVPGHVITASASANGSISPSGAVNVAAGSNQSFTVTPNPGYAVASVVVDGSSVGALTSYQFSNVTANHAISASFTPQAVTVPSVVGLTQSAAAAALGSAGLVVGTIGIGPHASVPVGSVIEQSPGAGSTAFAGTAVALTVSAGVVVPNTVGQTQSAATLALTSAGFLVTSSTQASAGVPSGSVISQNPAGGASASGGSTVALVVSSGAPANITLANVQSAQSTASGSFVDLAYTVPNIAGSQLLLVVYGGAEASTTNLALPTGATFHGVAMNVAAQLRTPATGINAGSGLYWMPVSPNETGTIRLSFTGSSDERAVGAVTLVGAASTGPEAVETATGTASLTDQITTLSPNAMVISTATQGNNGALTATGTGHVLDASAALASSRMAGGHADVATPSSRTLGYSGTINRIAMILASFPVGAPSGPPPNAPPVVTLTSPTDRATGLGASAMLTASVTDTDATTVTFYGRRTAPAVPGPDFVIGTLPDTQYYSQNAGGALAATFFEQTQWYADSRAALNIAFISHLGDMVQSGDNGTDNSEWTVADTAMRFIEDAVRTGLLHGIPWGGAPGNHDQTTVGQVNAPNLKWNQFFGADRWAGRPYFGGSFLATNNSNNYALFEASGLEFLIIHLDYTTAAGVNQAVIDWADALMKAHPRRRVIVTSHWILDLPPTSPIGAPASFGGPGQRFFDEFKDNPNFFLMLSGHEHGEGRRADVVDGRTINSVLQDYQGRTNGGDGWLRYFVFSPANNTITAKTYSPTLNLTETDTDATSTPRNQASEFVLPYNMQSAVAPWTTLGTASVAPGGGSAQFNWTGLEEGATYEWYVTASDGAATTTSPVRIFSTADSTAPSVALTSPANNAVFTSPVNITLAATAADVAGSIAKVEFFAGATKLGEDTTSPYSFTWTNAPAGSHSITARATDDENAATTSAAVAITVNGPANAPPTVALTAPANNAVVTAPASVTLTATAGDTDGTVSKVEFFQGATRLGEDTTSPYSFTWSGVPAGSYSLTALATDSSNATTTSIAVNITVNAPPSAALTAPASGATFSTPGTITLTANAGDGDGTVTLVEFYSGTTKLGEDATSPYSYTWTNPPAGSPALTARATDNRGAITVSSPVTIQIAGTTPMGLVAAYDFDDGAGTVLTDVTARGHNGTISGATWTASGHSGSALTFSGSQRVTVGDANDLDLTTGMTLEAWVYPTAVPADWTTVILKENNPSLAYALYAGTPANRPEGYVNNGSDRGVTGTAAVAQNTWTHLATTYDGATLRLYVNGVQVVSQAVTGAIRTSSGALSIGGNAVWGEYFRGRIDDVRVYNRALSAAEVQTDMNTPVRR
jgi:autotransporter-associated beta strand protein